jgi:hypothetical protein
MMKDYTLGVCIAWRWIDGWKILVYGCMVGLLGVKSVPFTGNAIHNVFRAIQESYTEKILPTSRIPSFFSHPLSAREFPSAKSRRMKLFRLFALSLLLVSQWQVLEV